jgi:mannose-6-phosphate isomerase
MSTALHPLHFRPIYRDYLWGGRRLAEIFHRELPPGVVAESWEISDRPDGMSIVDRGPWAGRTLGELVEALGPALVGSAAGPGRFPLLIKVIDAATRTSLQVHPDEAAAARLGGEPKTEMWYALHGPTGGRVFAGLRAGVDRRAFEEGVRGGSLEPLLQPADLEPGEALLMPGGRVHAIDAGCLLLEIQQNSNTTLRVFDWGRTSPDGIPRPLHLAAALDTIRWDDPPVRVTRPRLLWRRGGNARWKILDGEHFHVARLDLREELRETHDGRSFHALFVETGRVDVLGGGETLTLERGESGLIPAGLQEYRLRPVGEAGTGTAVVIATSMGARPASDTMDSSVGRE